MWSVHRTLCLSLYMAFILIVGGLPNTKCNAQLSWDASKPRSPNGDSGVQSVVIRFCLPCHFRRLFLLPAFLCPAPFLGLPFFLVSGSITRTISYFRSRNRLHVCCWDCVDLLHGLGLQGWDCACLLHTLDLHVDGWKPLLPHMKSCASLYRSPFPKIRSRHVLC